MSSSKSSTDELQSLFDRLSFTSKSDGLAPPHTAFEEELSKSPFSIFTSLSDLGFYSWTPRGSYKDLSAIESARDIQDSIDYGGKQDKLSNLRAISLPQTFRYLPPQEYENKYPHGETAIASLYVAFQHRGLDPATVDFVFGGSTPEMLANENQNGDPYMLALIPGTRAILVVKKKRYTQNKSDPGFQFERLVTGKSMSDRPKCNTSTGHLHLMKIGKYTVLFNAEVDAIKGNEVVEVKASNPYFWETKVMFQMISSDSTKLCADVKTEGFWKPPNSKISRTS